MYRACVRDMCAKKRGHMKRLFSMIFAAVMTVFYPITRKKYEEIKSELEKRS